MLKLIILFAFNLFEENNEDRKCMSGVECAGSCVFAVRMAATQGRNGATKRANGTGNQETHKDHCDSKSYWAY